MRLEAEFEQYSFFNDLSCTYALNKPTRKFKKESIRNSRNEKVIGEASTGQEAVEIAQTQDQV